MQKGRFTSVFLVRMRRTVHSTCSRAHATRFTSAMSSEKENEDPNPVPSKKRRLSLSLKGRFKTVSEDQLTAMSKPSVPKNTEKSSKWAIKNLKEWYEDYNSRNTNEMCPEEILSHTCSKEVLDKWLCVFINETRSRTGDPYPPKTIQAILAGILRAMRAQNPNYPNFFNKEDPSFTTFNVTIDNLFKSLRADGVGAQSGHTESISIEEEDQLWNSGVLNAEDPRGLLHSVFFMNGKCFCLRGGQEHRDLGVSQLQRLYKPDRYVYREKASKNRPGGIEQTRLDHKSVTIVANPRAGSRCHVFLLDKYIKKLPKGAIEKDLFYCKPLSIVPKDESSPWYCAVPVGKNILANIVKDMCSEAGLEGKKTNHSLRVAGATCLFEAGVPERVIQKRTGHRCLQSLREYERVSNKQEMAVSRVLSGEVDHYEPNLKDETSASECKAGIELAHPSPSTSNSESATAPGIQYNNCTVNVYGTGYIPGMPVNALGYMPPFPAEFGCYYPPSYATPYSSDQPEDT